MLDLAIRGGTMKITDDNKTIVSGNIASEIDKNIEITDAGDKKKPELTIIDDRK